MCYYQENKADIARTWLVRVSSSRAHDPIVYAPSSTNQNALRPPVDLSAQLVLANEVFRFSCATRVLPLKTVKFCCQLSWKENLEMSNEWSHGLFSCFEDCSTCELMRSSRQTDLATDFFSFFFFFFFFLAGILTWFCPCYVFGKNAEHLGESCILYALALFVPLLDLYCLVSVRGRIREQKGIEGTCLKDLLCVWCCGPCALVQEARVRAGTSNLLISYLFRYS